MNTRTFQAFCFTALFICDLVSLNSFAQTSVPGGNVSGTWTLAGSPYNVQGSINIPNDSTLSIQPGVNVIFQGAYKLLVLGRLLAIGTAVDSVTFTAANTGTGWLSIRFKNTASTNDSSKIVFCRLLFGKATAAAPDNDGGGICFDNFSKAVVANSSIRNCVANNYGGGIFCNSASPHITDNNISNNSVVYGQGGGIYCSSGSSVISGNTIFGNMVTSSSVSGNGAGIYSTSGNLTIDNNVISGNSAIMNGGGIYSTGGSDIISDNIISGNSTAGTGGGIYCTGGSNLNISINTIFNNTANRGGGISCVGNFNISRNTITNNSANFSMGNDGAGGGIYCFGSSPVMSDNVIANNSVSSVTGEGGGIYCNSSNPKITNNTIANNSAPSGGGIYCTSSSDPVFRNSILWGNTAGSGPQVFLNDEPSDPDFYYCDVQGGIAAFAIGSNFYTGAYQNNINADPLFVSPSGGSGTGFNGTTANWSLQAGSPCVDAGDSDAAISPVDLSGNPRISGCVIDMGAYELQKGFAPEYLNQFFFLCKGQSVTVGNNTYSSSGIYIDTFASFHGCDSTVMTVLTVNSADTSVAVSGGTLTANSDSATYVWIDCNNGNIPVPAQTGKSFTPAASGSYAVIVTENNCTDTSGCYNMIISGTIDLMNTDRIILYPNPTTGNFIVKLEGQGKIRGLKIYNILGEIIFSVTNHNGQTQLDIDISHSSKGIYFAEIYDAEKIYMSKIVLQ